MNENNREKPKSILKFYAPILLGALLFGVFAGLVSNWRTIAVAAPVSTVKTYDSLRTFAEVLALIQNYYVEEKSEKELSEGAIKGLLRILDPHSAYMDKEAFQNRKADTEGKFGGLGIEITVHDSKVMIVAPIEETPAERAGLKAGDIISEIDGTSTKNMSLIEAVKLMRGEIGTEVTLTIERDARKKPFKVTIMRDVITVKSVKYGMINEEVGYLRLLSFSQNTATDVRKAMEDLERQKAKKLVLDLRNNPGGLLKQAVDVSDIFLESGQVIVSTKGRTADQNAKFSSHSWGGYTEIPMVVLINAGSASASEIVAGAFKDLKRAVVVGTRSFGKGSVQTIRQLSDGSGLSLTTARYYTPSGTLIHGVGIEPDIEVKYQPDDENGEQAEPFREKDLIEQFNGNGKGHDLMDTEEAPDAKQEDSGKEPDKDSKKEEPKKLTKEDLLKRRKLFDLEKDEQLKRALEVLATMKPNKKTAISRAG